MSFLIACAILLLAGKSPVGVFDPPGVPRGGVFGGLARNFSGYDSGMVVFWTTVYTFTGLAVAYAFQAGLFNIGGEGQLLAAGFVSGVFAAALPPEWPAAVALPATIAVAFAAGAAWAAVPAILRARLGVHEVLSTILMNLVAPGVAGFALNRYRDAHKADLAEAVHTLPIPESTRLQSLEDLAKKALPGELGQWFSDVLGGDASVAFFYALVAALLCKWLIARTRGGYELRAVGQNVEAARAGGIAVPAVVTKALLVSGGLAGLASVPFVLGSRHYYEQGMLGGAGFTGIAVAVLAGSDPIGVLVAALCMAFLTQAGEVVNGDKPDQIRKEIVQVVEAVVIVSVLVARGIFARALARAEARKAKRHE